MLIQRFECPSFLKQISNIRRGHHPGHTPTIACPDIHIFNESQDNLCISEIGRKGNDLVIIHAFLNDRIDLNASWKVGLLGGFDPFQNLRKFTTPPGHPLKRTLAHRIQADRNPI
ncbi:hypothetical protein RF55_10051 [Lasius niger]|uniref:Uncharacterized protein n=1 Tax=Lasius niger TaxID=67767 RepID=A0A0J7KJ34_LASNI|nr:hypothetical protein RF55_10051 [Lasius niger]